MIHLMPMTEDEYDAFYEFVILDYAEGLVRAGNAHPDVAVELSHQQCQPVLSDRLASPGQFFYMIYDDALDARVGYLWWGIREQAGTRTAVLYFVGIFEPYRRRGYATHVLRVLEEVVKQVGLDEIRLYVFGHNVPAWELYEKMGFEVVSATMAKQIAHPFGGGLLSIEP
jgi:ribosomal protein S18 acetylase RimI-like enzyme